MEKVRYSWDGDSGDSKSVRGNSQGLKGRKGMWWGTTNCSEPDYIETRRKIYRDRGKATMYVLTPIFTYFFL